MYSCKKAGTFLNIMEKDVHCRSFPFFVYIERNYFMKKGDIFEGKVIRIEFPNKGIIDIEGQKES